ncbi:MAG: hypothetical protein IKT78_01995, partial [Ruminiclostridium sp.]|nr:hypothetical protein [Ruminiclostridium sp.]
MNPQYFERYSGYITAPFTATIVGIAVFLTAVAVIITAIRLFGNKSKALYAVNKTFSIIGLVTSILLTLAYLVIISLVALSAELFAYNGAGFIGATRDLACGIFLAPAKFGIAINSNRISTSIPFIFFTITVFSPAVLGYIAYIVSCIAQRSSVKARKSALQTEQTKAPAPIDNAETQPVPVTVAVATEEAT